MCRRETPAVLVVAAAAAAAGRAGVLAVFLTPMTTSFCEHGACDNTQCNHRCHFVSMMEQA